MVYMPHKTTKKCQKIARPFLGRCKLLENHPNGITVQPVDQHKGPPIRVNFNQITGCSMELPNMSWLGPKHSHCHKST